MLELEENSRISDAIDKAEGLKENADTKNINLAFKLEDGMKIYIPTIEESISLLVPQGIQSGERITIPNKGYKDGLGGRGNLIAEVKIMVPKNMSQEERELYSKLSKLSKFKPREIYG